MFLKLLKHDMKAVWRMWWFLLPAVPVLSLIASLLLRFMFACEAAEQTNNVLYTFATLALMLVFGIYIASTFYTTVLIFMRFYKNLYTDEAYLTFTLPVKRGTILLAKTANAMIWQTAHALVLMIGLLPVLLIAPPSAENGFFLNPEAYVAIWDFLCEAWELLGAWLILYAAELLTLALLLEFASITLIQFCITFGATVVKKAKLVLGIGVYYVLNSILGVVLELVLIFGIFFLVAAVLQLMPDPTYTAACTFLGLIPAIGCAAVATWGAMLYCTTRNIIERKLNLA